MKIVKKIFNYIIIGFISLFFISQYINSIFSSVNLTMLVTIIMILIVVVYVLNLTFAAKYISYIKKDLIFLMLALGLLCFSYFIYSYFFDSYYKFSSVIPFVLTLPLAHYIVKNNNELLFLKTTLIYIIIGLILIFSDFELVLKAIQSATRQNYLISPLSLSSISLIGSIISLILYLRSKSILYFFLFLSMLVSAFAGGSKGPFLAFILAISFYFFISSKYKSFFIVKSVAFVSFIYLLLVIATSYEIKIAERLYNLNTSNNQYNNDVRKELYQNTFMKIFTENIIFGEGVDTFDNFEVDYPHNIILELMYEIGFFNTFLILFIFGSIFFLNKLYKVDYHYVTLFIYLFIEAQLSHDLSFLRNILFSYFMLYFIDKKIKSNRILYEKNSRIRYE